MLVVVVVVVAGIGLIDAGLGRAAAPARGVGPAGTVVPPVSVESSAWFCAGGTGRFAGAPASVVMTNVSGRAVRGRLTAVSSQGPVRTQSVTVDAHGQTQSTPADLVHGAMVAAVVVLDGGGVGVTQVVSGSSGWSMAPCTRSTAASWAFAAGSTSSGNSLQLAVFNPGSSPAVVDVTFVTPSGPVVPPAYQGIEVAPLGLVSENLGDHVIDQPTVATQVVALSGTVVASELQVRSGSRAGLALVPGAAPATSWTFPQNMEIGQLVTTFSVFNPSTTTASLNVDVGLMRGRAEPLAMSVPGRSTVQFVPTSVPRVPSGTLYSLTFTSRSVPVVVQRVLLSGPFSPMPRFGSSFGVSAVMTTWVLPALPAPGIAVSHLTVVDLTSTPLTVRATALGRRRAVGTTLGTVRPGEPLELALLPGALQQVPLMLQASGSVAVEADAQPSGAPGVVVVPALAIG